MMNVNRKILSMIAIASMTQVACGDDTRNSGGGSVEARLAATYCKIARACAVADSGETAMLMLARLASSAECQAFVRRSFLASTGFDAKVASGVYTVDEAKLSQCISGLEASCGLTPPGICEEAISGNVPIGGACTANEDCAGDAWCPWDDCDRKCAARVALGAACTSSSACSNAAGSATCGYPAGRCVPVVQTTGASTGAACGEIESEAQVTMVRCAAGLACAPNQDGPGSTCRAPIPVGGACADDDAPCALGTICLPSGGDTGACQALPIASTAGATCKEEFGAADAMFCNPVLFLGCFEGKCDKVGDGSVGARCFADQDVGGHCLAANYCDEATSRCAAKKADGARCESGLECLADHCAFEGETGTCAANQCL